MTKNTLWSSSELEVTIDSEGNLLFTENPKISNDFIRIQPEELTMLSVHWLKQRGYDVKERLLPCPICGLTNLKIDNDDGWFSVVCENCGIMVADRYYKEQAINEWNRLPRQESEDS